MIPRNEYPRPQLVRGEWLNLNGQWDFEIDNAKIGEEGGFAMRESLNDKITVPFCPESKLSGIGHTDFMNCVWYRRNVEIPENWKEKNIILHFGAVDWHSIVFVNGEKVGEHKGGYTSFCFDITEYLKESGNYITLCAYDDVRSENQPAGKQCAKKDSYGCFYTRTTGIWQTVWMECVDKCYINNLRMTTEIENPSVHIEAKMMGEFVGAVVTAEAFWDGKSVGKAEVTAMSNVASLTVAVSEKHLWDVGQGNLYDLKITVSKNGEILDAVDSYFGLRTVALEGKKFKLNGRTVFGRWVLDQGFYPDGLYTAPTDEALMNDVKYGLELGFNGARLHEKIFEPRFLYWADKLGYLVWEEHANWNLNISTMDQIQYFLPEWMEAVERDFSHPSIIGWCPFNETRDIHDRRQCNMVIEMTYRVTKALDPTRPVIDTSGWFHTVTDIYDLHNYEQDPEKLAKHYDKAASGEIIDYVDYADWLQAYKTSDWDGKQPLFISEYGGIKWAPKEFNEKSWGYGDAPKTEEEFIERYKGLTDALLDNESIMGFCYTQLYDIEQEENGLMYYDRRHKFNPEIFYSINSRKAAIED